MSHRRTRFFALLLSTLLFGQPESSEYWFTTDVDWKLKQGITLSFEESIRMENQLDQFLRATSEATGEMDIFSFWSVFGLVRYAVVEDGREYRTGLGSKLKWKHNRVRTQYRVKLLSDWNDNSDIEYSVRNRIKSTGKLWKGFKVGVSYALFHQKKSETWKKDKTRLAGFAIISLPGKNELTLAWKQDRKHGKKSSEYIQILECKYAFKI